MTANRGKLSSKVKVLVAAFLSLVATVAVLVLYISETLGPASSSTLIMFVFADTDPQYLENLKFFVRHGVSEERAVDYIIIVQTNSPLLVRPAALTNGSHAINRRH